MQKKHKHRFISDTPQVIQGRCWAIAEDTTLSEQERRQQLNLYRKEMFTKYGFYSREFHVVDDFILRHKLTRSA